MALRSRPELNALNEGTPYVLSAQNATTDTGANVMVDAVLRQSADGDMVISLFNKAGISSDYKDQYKAPKLSLEHIDLSEGAENTGLKGGIEEGTEFINAKDPNDKYEVIIGKNDRYLLKRKVADAKYAATFDFSDPTLILYHNPKTKPAAETEAGTSGIIAINSSQHPTAAIETHSAFSDRPSPKENPGWGWVRTAAAAGAAVIAGDLLLDFILSKRSKKDAKKIINA
jgi:hypothetical protein